MTPFTNINGDDWILKTKNKKKINVIDKNNNLEWE